MKIKYSLIGLLILLVGCAAMQKITDRICNPTPEQQAQAQAMLQAIDQAQAIVANFVPIADIVQASVVLTKIKKGGCFLISELEKVFPTVDKANTVIQIAQNRALMAVKKAPKPIELPQYPALRMYVQ